MAIEPALAAATAVAPRPLDTAPSLSRCEPRTSREFPFDARFAGPSNIVLACGNQLAMQEGQSVRWFREPSAPCDLTLLSATADDVVATGDMDRELYSWHNERFARIALEVDAQVACADAVNRVVIYAADGKLFALDLATETRRTLPVSEETVAYAHLLGGCAVEGTHVLLPDAAAVELWDYRSLQRVRRMPLPGGDMYRASSLRVRGHRFGWMDCKGNDPCRARAFVLPGASALERASVNDLNLLGRGGEFAWADDAGVYLASNLSRGGLSYRHTRGEPLRRISEVELRAEVTFVESELRVRPDGKFAIATVSIPPSPLPMPTQHLYELKPGGKVTPLRCDGAATSPSR